MNKTELVEQIAKEFESKAAAERAVNAVLAAITKGLKKEGKVQIVGFGTFEVRKRKARTGRNPQTGEKIRIKASKTVGFKPGKGLKSSI
ncbi:MAG: HU family DNA-binding protein [Planctomycetota bacterium]|nr:MAG: HU family DNA-binding protein [Planctomycetota bacterium]